MKHYTTLFLFNILLIFSACKKDIIVPDEHVKSRLSINDFTDYKDIDPEIYYPTLKNMKADPNNQLMEMFRKKKAADMANPDKPRPFSKEEVEKLENISHEQPWMPLNEVFPFDWKSISKEDLEQFSKVARARIIFDQADLKVTELAVAPHSVIPAHAQPTPSAYFILGGEGLILSDTTSAKVYTGTTVKFDGYAKKRVDNTSDSPLKILWFSWAPDGDKSYLESGYYLTGSHPQIQSINAVLPSKFEFWHKMESKKYEKVENKDEPREQSPFVKEQIGSWKNLIGKYAYPNTPTYKSGNEIEWVDVMNMDPKSFFFADDLKSLGSTLEMMSKLAKIKSVFRAVRPDGGYDLNYSYLAWGPQSKYITHSHAICEFYYILEGDVEYIIDGVKYHGVPGNFYFHPPYYDHEMRGLKKDVPFLSISGSWIPYGKRELFDLPFYLLEDIPIKSTPGFSNDFNFHNFGMLKDEVEFGKL